MKAYLVAPASKKNVAPAKTKPAEKAPVASKPKRGERLFRVWNNDGSFTALYAKNPNDAYARLTVEEKARANNIVEFV